jgi:hypothetical protein
MALSSQLDFCGAAQYPSNAATDTAVAAYLSKEEHTELLAEPRDEWRAGSREDADEAFAHASSPS